VRYFVSVDGTEHELVVESVKGNEVVLTLGERRFEASVINVAPNAFSVLVDGRSFDLLVSRVGRELIVSSRNGSRRVSFASARGASRGAAVGAGAGRLELRAMMPGRVVDVMVAPGDEVEAEQGIVVIEAMKMENEVKTPKTGKVLEVRVRQGQTVEKGDLLAVIE